MTTTESIANTPARAHLFLELILSLRIIGIGSPRVAMSRNISVMASHRYIRVESIFYAPVTECYDWPFLEQCCDRECDGPQDDDGQCGIDTANEVAGQVVEGVLVEEHDGNPDARNGGCVEELDQVCNLGKRS
jgi:hypothetical protein